MTKRISVEFDLTDGQYEVLRDVTRYRQETITDYAKDTVLSLLYSDVDEILGSADPACIAAKKKLHDPADKLEPKKKVCYCCGEGEEEGELVRYGDGLFTSKWMVHRRCKEQQLQFNQMFGHRSRD